MFQLILISSHQTSLTSNVSGNTVPLCLLCFSRNRQRLLTRTTLADRFSDRKRTCLLRGANCISMICFILASKGLLVGSLTNTLRIFMFLCLKKENFFYDNHILYTHIIFDFTIFPSRFVKRLFYCPHNYPDSMRINFLCFAAPGSTARKLLAWEMPCSRLQPAPLVHAAEQDHISPVRHASFTAPYKG